MQYKCYIYLTEDKIKELNSKKNQSEVHFKN